MFRQRNHMAHEFESLDWHEFLSNPKSYFRNLTMQEWKREQKGGGLLSYGQVRRSFPRYLKHYKVPRKKKNDNFNDTFKI